MLFFLGAAVAIAGVLAAIAGGALLVLFGSSGTLHTGLHRVEVPAAALTSPAGSIQNASTVASLFGTPRIGIHAETTSPGGVFIGVATAADAARYLAGGRVAVVSDISLRPYSLRYTVATGSRALARPGDQHLWVAEATGRSSASLVWPISSGSYRVVVMREDASSGIDLEASFALSVPRLGSLAVGLLVGGIVAVLLAVALLVAAFRHGGRRRPRPRFG